MSDKAQLSSLISHCPPPPPPASGIYAAVVINAWQSFQCALVFFTYSCTFAQAFFFLCSADWGHCSQLYSLFVFCLFEFLLAVIDFCTVQRHVVEMVSGFGIHPPSAYQTLNQGKPVPGCVLGAGLGAHFLIHLPRVGHIFPTFMNTPS